LGVCSDGTHTNRKALKKLAEKHDIIQSVVTPNTSTPNPLSLYQDFDHTTKNTRNPLCKEQGMCFKGASLSRCHFQEVVFSCTIFSLCTLQKLYESDNEEIRTSFEHLCTDALWVKDKMKTSHALLVSSPSTTDALVKLGSSRDKALKTALKVDNVTQKGGYSENLFEFLWAEMLALAQYLQNMWKMHHAWADKDRPLSARALEAQEGLTYFQEGYEWFMRGTTGSFIYPMTVNIHPHT
jgi:hypothetical protein